jgi:hypothetical protein
MTFISDLIPSTLIPIHFTSFIKLKNLKPCEQIEKVCQGTRADISAKLRTLFTENPRQLEFQLRFDFKVER